MDFNQNTPLVFHWKNEELDKFLKFAPLVGILLLGVIPLILWLSFPSGFFSQIDWGEIGQKLWRKPIEMLQVLLILVAAPIGLWMQSRHQKNARLILDDNSVSYVSGLPLFHRWLDWHLDLEVIRSGSIKLRFTGNELGAQPVLMYRLSWGMSGLRHMRPAAWILPNQTETSVQKPTSIFGLVNWKRPENMALLQQQFDQLPLIKALLQRDVLVPQISKKREGLGLDLMAHPRMKVVVIGFFVTLVVAFALFHLMRHQHYFSTPPISYQVIAGAVAGLVMFVWLWGEMPNTGNTAEQVGFRGTQVLLACLFAVSAGLCAPSLPLLLGSTFQSSQEQAFTLQKLPLALKGIAPSDMPTIQPTQALEYWQSLKDGEVVNLPVRRGFAGLWWQYDSSELQDKVETFYDSQPRRH
jgi:hypothetical protein